MELSLVIAIVLGATFAAGALLLLFARWFERSSNNRWWLDPSTLFGMVVCAATVFALLVTHT